MKILLFSDVHWSKTSSIVRGLGVNYTQRLECLIKSMNWVNELCEKEKCDFMICAGDMMDKSTCDDMELTALKDIQWNSKDCYFLCGNHESSVIDLRYSSLKVLESKNHYIVNKPFTLELNDSQIHFIPYVTESVRESIQNYLSDVDKLKKQIIISHNDIKGIHYGGFESKMGFSIEEIERCSDIYLNGHLHNQSYVTKKILNVGSLSAHNFTNDSFNYKYGVWILNTDTLELEFIENPYAINFYKVDILKENDLSKLDKLKNACVSITIKESLIGKVKEKVKSLSNIITHRTVVIPDDELVVETNSEELLGKVNHLDKFNDFILTQLGNLDIVKYELEKVCNWKGKE